MIRLGLVIWFCLGLITSSAQITDCQLSRLSVSCGILSPNFQPNKNSYILTLSSTTSLNEIQLTPVTDCNGCEIQINGQNVASNSTWFLADGKKKIRIEIINREKKLNSYYYVFINQITPTLFTDDSLKLKNVEVTYGSKKPKWLDKNGYLYATLGNTISKSTDLGLSWNQVYEVPDSLGGNVPLPTLIVSETGRIIYCSNGKVLVSDENQKNFTTKYSFYNGASPKEHLAHSMYDSIIL